MHIITLRTLQKNYTASIEKYRQGDNMNQSEILKVLKNPKEDRKGRTKEQNTEGQTENKQ